MEITDLMPGSVAVELIQYIDEAGKEGRLEGLEERTDVHNELFNSDYYIIGNYQAKQWLEKHEIDVFDAIGIVQDWEKEVLGEVKTPVQPENIVNMLVYIWGEYILEDIEK